MSKADYVRAQGQTRGHMCHWPGCGNQVPPAMWGCRRHWFALPLRLRAQIWATYRPGQEVNWTPSAAYLEAAKAAIDWIKSGAPGHPAQALGEAIAKSRKIRAAPPPEATP